MELHERIKAAQSAEADHNERQVDPFAELKTRLHLAIIGELGPQLYNSRRRRQAPSRTVW